LMLIVSNSQSSLGQGAAVSGMGSSMPSTSPEALKENCEAKSTGNCFGYAAWLKTQGEAFQAEKVLRESCAKHRVFDCAALAIYYAPMDNIALLEKSCVNPDAQCSTLFSTVVDGSRFIELKPLAEILCKQGDASKCDFLSKLDQIEREFQKKSTAELARTKQLVSNIRKKNLGKPVKIDIQKSGWGQVESSLLNNELKGERLRFPISNCLRLSSFASLKNYPTVSCQGGGRKFIFKVIADKQQAIDLPKNYGLIPTPTGWFTATVVDVVFGSYQHDIYVVTD
jgi:hypothetical protein